MIKVFVVVTLVRYSNLPFKELLGEGKVVGRYPLAAAHSDLSPKSSRSQTPIMLL